MALTRRESFKLLGASLLASGASAASAKPADARPPGRSDEKKAARDATPPSTVSMKRLYALPIILDY